MHAASSSSSSFGSSSFGSSSNYTLPHSYLVTWTGPLHSPQTRLAHCPEPIEKHLRSMEQELQSQREHVHASGFEDVWPIPDMDDSELEAAVVMGTEFLEKLDMLDLHQPLKQLDVVRMTRCMERDYLTQDSQQASQFLRQWSAVRSAQEQEQCLHDVGYAMIFGDNPTWRYHGLMYTVESMLMAFDGLLDRQTIRTLRSISVPLNWTLEQHLDYMETKPYTTRAALHHGITGMLEALPPVMPLPRKRIEETSTFFVILALHPHAIDYYFASDPNDHHQVLHLDALREFLFGSVDPAASLLASNRRGDQVRERERERENERNIGSESGNTQHKRPCLRDILARACVDTCPEHIVVRVYLFLCEEYPLQVPPYTPGEFLKSNARRPHEAHNKEHAWKEGDRKLWNNLQ